MPATYNDLYLDARRALKAAGVEQAQLEARELLCRASGKTREDLLRDLPLYAPDGVTARFQGLMARRMAGEPVAYLIGEWEFYGLTRTSAGTCSSPAPTRKPWWSGASYSSETCRRALGCWTCAPGAAAWGWPSRTTAPAHT